MWLLRRPDFCASTWFFPGYPTAFIGEPPFSAVSNPRFHLTHTFSPEKCETSPFLVTVTNRTNISFSSSPWFLWVPSPLFRWTQLRLAQHMRRHGLPERLAEAAAGEVSGQGPATDDALEVVGVGKCLGTKNEKSPSDIHIYIHIMVIYIYMVYIMVIYIYNGDIYIMVIYIYMYIYNYLYIIDTNDKSRKIIYWSHMCRSY